MFDQNSLASTVAGWPATLVEAVRAAGGLDDAGHIDLIRALEELTCTTTAAQAALTVELDWSQSATRPTRCTRRIAGPRRGRAGRARATRVTPPRAAAPRPGQDRPGRAAPHLDGMARGSDHRVESHPDRPGDRLPQSRGPCCRGRRRREDGARLEQMGERELTSACQQEAYWLDPSPTSQDVVAQADRHISLRPAPDAMTWLRPCSR